MKIETLAVAFAAASFVAASTPAAAASLSIPLHPQNGSGESGIATLRDTARGLVVTMHLTHATGSQPAHIHRGSCSQLNPQPAYPLHNVVNGMSSTTVPGVTIGSLLGTFAINVHKSTTMIATYVACGDIAR